MFQQRVLAKILMHLFPDVARPRPTQGRSKLLGDTSVGEKLYIALKTRNGRQVQFTPAAPKPLPAISDMTVDKNLFDNDDFKNEWLGHYAKNAKAVNDLYLSVMTNVDELLKLNHETIGRVLKCHLVIELYLNKFLEFELKLNAKNNLNLRFIQKVALTESIRPSLQSYMKGVREINTVRNKLAHTLNPILDEKLLPTTIQFAEFLNKHSEYPKESCELIDYIEMYTKTVCTAIAEKSTPLGKQIDEEIALLAKKYLDNPAQVTK